MSDGIVLQVDGRRAVVTLDQIKAKLDANVSASERLRQAVSGGFGQMAAALARLENPLERLARGMDQLIAQTARGSAGMAAQAGALDKVTKAATGAESAQKKLKDATGQMQRAMVEEQRAADKLAASMEKANLKATQSALSAQNSLSNRIGRQLGENTELTNRLTSATQRYVTTVNKAGAGSIAGINAKGAFQRELQDISNVVTTQAGLFKKLDEVKDAIPQKKGASRITAADKAMMAAWAPDMTQQAIASGGNILTPMLVQAPELAQLFSRLGASTKLLVGGFAGVATAVGVVVAAMSRLSDQQQNLRDLGVIIRATGSQGTLAAKDLAQLSDRINLLPGVSREAAEKTVQNLARIRGLGAAGIQGAAYLGADFARAIGEQDIAKATAKLGESLANPAKGARELNEALGFLSAGQLISIERMAAQGKRAEALQATLSALKPHLEGLAAQGMSPLAVATDRLGNSFDHLMSVVANSSAVVVLMEKMANAAQNVANAMNGPAWKWVLGSAAMANPATMPLALRSLTQAPEPKLSLPMPPLTQTQQAAGGAGGVLAKAAGASDAMKEVADTIAMADGYRGWRGEAEKLSDALTRVKRAQALTTDPQELALLRQAQAGIADQLRQAVDPKQKLVNDAARGARNEWRIAESPYDQRNSLRTQIEAETQAREAGLSAMQKEDLIRARLSEGAAKYLTGIQDSVRAKGFEVDATTRLAAVENGSIVDRQRVQDVLEKERFRREALSRATADNRDQILSEIAAYDSLIDRMGQANSASQLRSAAIGYSPTLQFEQFQKDAGGIEAKMREMGAPQEEITAMYEQAEMRKLDASRRWEDGASRAFKRVQSDATNYARHAETVITNSMSTIEDAFVQMAETGKFNFKDMARSIIGDLIRIQTRMTITAPLAGAMNNVFGGLFGGGAKTGGTSGAPTSLMPGEWSQGQLTPRIGDFYASGGLISGPGTGTSDSILARVSNGEFVVRASAVDRHLGLLNAINDNRLPAFAEGGYVGGMAPLARGPEASTVVAANSTASGTVNNIAPNISVTVEGSASSGDSEMDERQAQRIARAVDGQVRATVVSELQRQMRGGGMLNRV